MSMKATFFWFNTLLVLVKITICASSEVYVSREIGRDNAVCGNISFPCETLHQAFKVSPVNGSIKLFNEYINGSSMIYLVTRLWLRKNLTLSAVYKNRARPMIVVRGPIIFFQENSFYNISLSSVHFFSAKSRLFSFQSERNVLGRLKVNIGITDCKFENFKDPVIHSLYYFNNLSSLDIQFRHSIFQAARLIQLYAKDIRQVKLSIKHCLFYDTGTAMDISVKRDCRGRLSQNSINIEESRFINSYVFLVGCISVQMNLCLFSRTKKNSVYDNSFLNIQKTLHTNISNCKFLNNKIAGAVRIHNNYRIELWNCEFINNTAANGGAIFSAGNDLVIKKTSFISNCAELYGGSLYISLSDGVQILNKMILLDVKFLGQCKTASAGYVIYVSKGVRTSFFRVMIDVGLVSTDETRTVDVANHLTYVWKVIFYCPTNFKVLVKAIGKVKPVFALKCIKCNVKSYSVVKDTIMIFNTSYFAKEQVKLTQPAVCHACPAGGECLDGIKSRDNFWGFVNNEQRVKFLPCPNDYCCSKYGKQCVSYNACANNREGRLCGKCRRGYSLNYFGNDCVKRQNCYKFLFWFFVVLYVFSYVFVLMYLPDLVFIVYRLFALCTRCIKCQLNYSFARQATVTMNDCRADIQASLPLNDVVADHSTNRDCPAIDEAEDEAEVDKVESNEGSTKNVENSIEDHSTVSTVKNIIFFFYQIEFLIQVSSTRKEEHGFLLWFRNFALNLFNFNAINAGVSKICPSSMLQSMDKELTKEFITLSLFIALLFCFVISLTVSVIQKKFVTSTSLSRRKTAVNSLTFSIRLKLCFVQLLLLTYTSVSSFVFKMINCVDIGDTKYLFIYGDLACYTWWQYVLIVFTVLWICPFALSIHFATKMLQENHISSNLFLLCVSFPPICLGLFVKKYLKKEDTVSQKKFVERQYILASFIRNSEKVNLLFPSWEVVIVIRRLILSAICTFVINPVHKLFAVIPVMVLFWLHNVYASPYHKRALNALELLSITFLLVIGVFDIFWAFDYMLDLSTFPGRKIMVQLLPWFEDIVLAIPLSLFILGLCYIFVKKLRKFCSKVKK